jgi:hypothetical protein
MHRRLVPLVSLALAACAGKPGGATPAAEPGPMSSTTHVIGNGDVMGITTTSDSRGALKTVAVPIERAWEALPATYAAVGVDYTTLDKRQWVIGNDGLKARRRLGGVPLTRLVNCGGTDGNPNAATYEVTLSVFTQLIPAGAGETTVRTTVQGPAKSLSFTTDAVNCASTRVLEDRIAGTLAVEAAKLEAKK